MGDHSGCGDADTVRRTLEVNHMERIDAPDEGLENTAKLVMERRRDDDHPPDVSVKGSDGNPLTDMYVFEYKTETYLLHHNRQHPMGEKMLFKAPGIDHEEPDEGEILRKIFCGDRDE